MMFTVCYRPADYELYHKNQHIADPLFGQVIMRPWLRAAGRLLVVYFSCLTLPGVLADPPETTSGCLQLFKPNGTTSATRLTTIGDSVSTERTVIINMTPLAAPCGPDWATARTTMTIFIPECDETQVRDEPRLTSSVVISTVCVFVSAQVIRRNSLVFTA